METKTRLEYIKELRKRFLWAFVPSIAFLLIAFIQTPNVINILLEYYSIPVVSLSPAESISASLNFATIMAMALFVPLILYQIFGFSRELLPKRSFVGLGIRLFLGFVLTIGGFLFGVTILGKFMIQGLMLYNIGMPLWSLSSVLKTTALFGLGVACSVQMVWFIPTITKHNLVSKQTLKHYRKFLFVGLLIMSALITPPDIMSMGLMMLPLYGSFETGLLLSKSKREVSIC
jgi:sec-independent protein translocase protein TatC